MDPYGAISCYNGSTTPFLTRYFPQTDSFTHKGFAGWSGSGGSVAAVQSFVFVTDGATFSSETSGVIRFDLATGTARRFADGLETLDVNVGLDGYLYVLFEDWSAAEINVYDPVTLALVRHVTLPQSISGYLSGVAADASGRIFICGMSGTVYRLSSTGVVEASKPTGSNYLNDIDLDETGRLIVGHRSGLVLLGEATLANAFTSFTAGGDTTFVSFARTVPQPSSSPAPTPVPTPLPQSTSTHNILVSVGLSRGGGRAEENTVREFDRTGAFIRKTAFSFNGEPYPSTEFLRDVVVDRSGSINAFNGTYYPLLSRYARASESFSHRSFPGWSIWNIATCGSLVSYGNFVYAADMSTTDDPPASGMIQFNTATNDAQRVAAGISFIDLAMGLNGKLYGLFSPYGPNQQVTEIKVYDPSTATELAQIRIPPDIAWNDHLRAIAVDQKGRIFLAGFGGAVYRLNSSGVFDAAEATGFGGVRDMDLDETGRLILAQDDGALVLVGEANLQHFDSFQVYPDGSSAFIFVAFADAIPTLTTQGLKITSASRLPGGAVLLRGVGAPNAPNTIEFSPDLVSQFRTLNRVEGDAEGRFEYLDSAATGVPQRFYRLAFP